MRRFSEDLSDVKSYMNYEIANCKVKINEKIIDILGIKFNKVGSAGANGVVFFGYDTQLERKVAVKFWLPMKNDTRPKKKQALLEARKVAQLNEQHIVQIYTVGEVENYFYAIEEYIDGITLKKWLEKKPGFERRIGIWNEIVKGMRVAHERKIYHGDLHTENILITQDEKVKIIDFGTSYFARSTKESKARESRLLIETAFAMFPECQQYNVIFLEFNKIPEVTLAMLDRWVEILGIFKRLMEELQNSRDDYSIRYECNSLALRIAIVPLFDIDKVINILSRMGLENSYTGNFISYLSSYSEQIMQQKKEVLVWPLHLEDLQSVKSFYKIWRETYLEKWEYYLAATQ